MGYIYKITNKLNNKCYIGQTINDVENRWNDHRKCIGTQHGCPGLRRAFEKYGLDNFKFEVVIICFNKDMSKYEKEYIKKYDSYKNGYNLTHGGEEGGFFTGCKHTPENVAKIKQRWAEYNANPENRKHISERMKAHYADPKNREEHSKRMKATYARLKVEGKFKSNLYSNGHIMTDERKQKISDSLLKYYNNNTDLPGNGRKQHSEAMTKAIGRKVSQYSLTGEFMKIYDSIKIAAKESGGSFKSIGHNLRERTKSSGGFIWKYAIT
jgi:group I intron endonuclease